MYKTVLFRGLLTVNNATNVFTSRWIHCTRRMCMDDDDAHIKLVTKVKQNIGFIGDGNMARAICKGVTNQGLLQFNQIHVSSPYIKNLDKWKQLGANVTTDNGEIVRQTDIIFLAVKPHILQAAVEQIRDSKKAGDIKNKLFVSILAGFTINKLERLLSIFEGSRVIRVMPNTPMMVGAGCTVYSPGQKVTDNDISIVRAILAATGVCQRVDEHHFDAVTALSGAAPAFTYLFIEALSDGAVRVGLPRPMATTFAAQTVLGAAKMVLESGKHTGELKDQVCSAGGVTIAGVHELEMNGLRGTVMNAVRKSAKKAVEIGQAIR